MIAVPLLIDLFQPRSVLEVGCATGVWLSVFQQHGVEDILGIDGAWIEQRQREIPDVFFREYDRNTGCIFPRIRSNTGFR
jgi:hypothetical protein